MPVAASCRQTDLAITADCEGRPRYVPRETCDGGALNASNNTSDGKNRAPIGLRYRELPGSRFNRYVMLARREVYPVDEASR
jgi:hypothetical protein